MAPRFPGARAFRLVFEPSAEHFNRALYRVDHRIVGFFGGGVVVCPNGVSAAVPEFLEEGGVRSEEERDIIAFGFVFADIVIIDFHIRFPFCLRVIFARARRARVVLIYIAAPSKSSREKRENTCYY